MNKEDAVEVEENLLQVIRRVSNDKNASPAEIAALPEIVRALIEFNSYCFPL